MDNLSLFGRHLKLRVLEGENVETQLIDDYLLKTIRPTEIVYLRKSRIKTYIMKCHVKEYLKD